MSDTLLGDPTGVRDGDVVDGAGGSGIEPSTASKLIRALGDLEKFEGFAYYTTAKNQDERIDEYFKMTEAYLVFNVEGLLP